MAAAAKSKKIIDVTDPDAVKPEQASGRPIIVTNRPVLANDPMVKPEETAGELPSAPTLSRHGKTVAVPGGKSEAELEASVETTEPEAPAAEAEPEPAAKDAPTAPETSADASTEDVEEDAGAEVAPPQPEAEAEKPEPAPKAEEPAGAGLPEDDKEDGPAEGELSPAEQRRQQAQEAAARKAEEELEDLIESGAYHLPIRSTRQRSALITLVLALLILILAVVLLDLLLDVGLVHLSGIPHTSYFQTK